MAINKESRETAMEVISRAFSRTRAIVVLVSILTAISLLAAAPVALGQVGSSSTLRGVVKDPSGAVISGATVTLTGSRGDQRTAKTGDDGAYVFTAVDAGTYSLTVQAEGFKKFEKPGISIAPSETHSTDVQLEVGATTETVVVTTQETPIKTDTGERSDTITSKQIDNLSIIGRSSLELLRILPGVVAPNAQAGGLDLNTFGGGSNANAAYTVNGVRGVDNQVSIDGSRVIDIGSNNGTIITPNVDMVQEVTVKTSNFAAEYSSSGVQVSAVTKAGSKQYHGELYDYWRPNALTANDRSNTIAGAPKPLSHFQYPGGNIGGPIPLPWTHFNENKDKLFFFVAFEAQRQTIDPGLKFGISPTAAERNGNFSGSRSVFSAGICPPSTFQYAPCSTPVPGGNLSAMADPLGKALLNLYPMPNFNPPAGSAQAASHFNYASDILSPDNRTDFKTRIDYNITKSTKMYLRLARENEGNDSPYGIWWGPSNYELPTHLFGTNTGRSAALNLVSVISPTMTNEVVLSVSKLKLDYNFVDPSKLSKTALGVQNVKFPFSTSTPYVPLALISWDLGSQLWEPGNIPLFAHNDSVSLNDTISKIYRAHTLKFGALVERADKTQDFQGTPEGQVEFEASGQPRTTGNAFANLYVGQIDGLTQSTVVPTGHFRQWNFESFAQDSWKVRPNFTFDYGVRFSFYPNNYERDGLAVAFDPSTYIRGAGAFLNGNPQTPNGYLLASKGQIPKGVFSNNPFLIGPRLGFAWDIFGDASTVIRGGAGVFYNRVQGNYQYGILQQPPNTLTAGISAWNVPNQDLTLGNMGTINPINALQASAVASQDLKDNKIPTIYNVSLSIARRLPFQTVLEASYVGTFGRHLPQTIPINYINPSSLPATLGNANLRDPLQRAAVASNSAALSQLLPFPDYSGVDIGHFFGTSNYHSLQVTLNHQAGKRLQFFATYTFSKALGTTANSETGGSDVNPLDIRGRNYGILSYDRTHIFNISYNYNFPDAARGRFKNKFTDALMNGWQMSGITTFASGQYIPLTLSGAITNAQSLFAWTGTTLNLTSTGNTGSIAPTITGNAVTGHAGASSNYLNLADIGIPSFGNSGPYQSPFYIRYPGTNNFDVTFFKNFQISESKKIQFRMGFFNIFNEAFADPSTADINTTLYTVCNATAPAGIPNGTGLTTSPICDPTKGFHFAGPADGLSQDTVNTFGRIISQHGHRRIELAFKFYF